MEGGYYQPSANPLVEGWLENFNQQDFREGAKGLNSLHPVSHPFTSDNFSSYNEWMDSHETLGCNEFDLFKDVLLPEDDLGSDYFRDGSEKSVFIPHIFDANDLGTNNDVYDNDDKFLNCSNYSSSEKPKVTIKLKKVKVPKNKRLRQKDLNVYEYEVANSSEPAVHYLQDMDVTSSFQEESTYAENADLKIGLSNEFDCSPKSEIDNLDLDNYLQLDDYHITEVPSSLLTLKEAINMENADNILDAYLSSPGRSSFSLGSPREQPVNLLQENLFSPGTSQYSYSESEDVSSPLSLEDAVFDVDLTAETQILSSNDSCSTSEKELSRKGRKPRQKMTSELRYLRKKEQNKQAALRYRAKKKLEDEQLMQTLKDIESRNIKLKKQSKSLNQELKFLKQLLRESLVARNLVPPGAFH